MEFGRLGINVNGTDVKPRIKKSYELFAYLIDKRKTDVSRDELLEALFAGQVSDSNLSYLRQAIHYLRHVLPDEMTLDVTGGRVRFDAATAATSDSVRFEELTSEAAALRGEQRLNAMLRGLALIDRGNYLPGVKSAWAEQQRSYLRDRPRWRQPRPVCALSGFRGVQEPLPGLPVLPR
jgi:two-component SAPR family response regulator